MGLNKATSYDSLIRLWGGGNLIDINIQIGKNLPCRLIWENVAYHQVRSSVLEWQLVPDMYESGFGLVAIWSIFKSAEVLHELVEVLKSIETNKKDPK